ncbi:MAG: histidine triad nucleotide-binding protein [Zoogloeaceae bacterium]|jgi:histidine triad (HIT) family protein|nr:histidine triad nucleotide-binding protein [Zoogloeaceae bacterium]
MTDCIFCKIIQGEIPSKKAFEDDLVYAFHDIHPLRPTHLLVIPKRHIASLAEVGAEDEPVLGRMLSVAHRLAKEHGSPNGFRSIINTGLVGGQEVAHLHLHILGDTKPVGVMVTQPT